MIESVHGPRDQFGAIVQPENSSGKAPYGWCCWETGFSGKTEMRVLDLKPEPRTAKPVPPGG
jgi:hypothetical protein